VQQFLLDNLGRAIDRLIERSTLLDKDRTLLAHALSRVQQELLRVRASHDDLEQRCRYLEARQEEAALRLEKLLASMPQQAEDGAAEELRAIPDAAPAAVSAAPQKHADPVSQETHEPLARNTVKPFDIGSLTRIARLAADSTQGKSPGKPEGEADTQKANAALDTAAEFQDRLF
jgi:hypothetical protein